MYAKGVKRVLDFILSLAAIIVLSPLLLVLTVVGAIKMKGNPFFIQKRPGRNEKIFKLVKFRTMTNARDSSGELLPDEKRLVRYGKFLRSTSLDELPELFNILIGEMSLVGPRPQLVRDMVFMSDQQRLRHTVRPGLSGLAQVTGRNAVSWEEKLNLDLRYIEKITFWGDLKIIGLTIGKVVGRCENSDELDVTDDYGDYLLKTGKVSREKYNTLQALAKNLIIK